MREIKFRGKRPDNGEWVYGDLVHTGTDTIAILESGAPCLEAVTDVVPESVGQFIGFHDKNGKEIYEGDIIKSKYAIHYVRYIEDQAMFVANIISKKPLADYCSIFQTWIDKYNKVVIGNIHDNPELLKTK